MSFNIEVKVIDTDTTVIDTNDFDKVIDPSIPGEDWAIDSTELNPYDITEEQEDDIFFDHAEAVRVLNGVGLDDDFQPILRQETEWEKFCADMAHESIES